MLELIICRIGSIFTGIIGFKRFRRATGRKYFLNDRRAPTDPDDD